MGQISNINYEKIRLFGQDVNVRNYLCSSNPDFYNQDHVNSIGARKFTAYVGEYIKTHYDIDTSLSHEEPEEWKRAVALDNKEYKECVEVIMADVNK